MKKNYIWGGKVESPDFVNLSSTDTTSITIITGITSTASTEVNYTQQTMYFNGGSILGFSTVTSSGVAIG